MRVGVGAIRGALPVQTQLLRAGRSGGPLVRGLPGPRPPPIFSREGPWFAAAEAAINASALRAFVWLADDDEMVTGQHPATATRPPSTLSAVPAGWCRCFRTGNYYIHMSSEMRRVRSLRFRRSVTMTPTAPIPNPRDSV